MPRSDRLFEIIQLLRAARGPRTADDLGTMLEVSTRTIYRDIAALQAMRVPIEGAAGLGYVLRRGYDLPPLNFDLEEIEALRVGLAMLARTGDSMLIRAAHRVFDKIDALHGPADWLRIAPEGAPIDNPEAGCVPIALLRRAIRDEAKLVIRYKDPDDQFSDRTIRPIVLIYYADCVVLAAWCELRQDFRHFRCDRLYESSLTGSGFKGQGDVLRNLWHERETSRTIAAATHRHA